ncbi:MBL fold metallo-hydrolase [Pelagibacterium lacus]|uniref:MBL fold metallo-hydrolase n=1 Tax=Pelagibacterium lacus TaxID=2282655 RepID=A0A369W5G5_9HYPH|nr:MBL fold metallo-hydrolase [Pelagibacterium lacus]RDE09583.1 MBL fold metallo-hydrolase [Pelagibacterium lacus]
MYDRDSYETARGPLIITPIHHATLVLEWNGETILCDPVGGAQRFAPFAAPTLIMLTHHHGDHLDLETLEAVLGDETVVIAPQTVFDQLPPAIAARTRTLANGDETEHNGIQIRAVAMYNTTPERQKYHEKGVGNGYLFDFAGTRVYLASDTEPTPEMEALGAVDIAFFPMNLPFTMTPDQVVEAIGKVQPRYAYPFHYRFPYDAIGTEPEALVAAMPEDSQTRIVARDWYGPV